MLKMKCILKIKLVLLLCFPFLLNATIYEGSTTVIAGGVSISMEWSIDTVTDTVTVTLIGPHDKYYAFGFNTLSMQSGTYAIVVDNDGSVFEQMLGFHSQGSPLASSISVTENSILGTVRTVKLKRAITGLSGSYFSFPSTASTTNLIFARGTGAFSYHGANKGSTAISTTILPVKFSQFNLSYKDNKVLLFWQTESEIDNDKFEIQRSNDGSHWITLGYKKGNITSSVQNNYTFEDPNPRPGINYYRLKQIDLNSNYEYSSIISIDFNPDLNNELVKIYPTTAQNNITIETSLPFEKEARIQIINNRFQIVKDIFWSPDTPKMDINIDELTPGAYFIIVNNNYWVHKDHFVKI